MDKGSRKAQTRVRHRFKQGFGHRFEQGFEYWFGDEFCVIFCSYLLKHSIFFKPFGTLVEHILANLYFKRKSSVLFSLGDMGEKRSNNVCIYKESLTDTVGEKCKKDSLFQTIGASDGSVRDVCPSWFNFLHFHTVFHKYFAK